MSPVAACLDLELIQPACWTESDTQFEPVLSDEIAHLVASLDDELGRHPCRRYRAPVVVRLSWP